MGIFSKSEDTPKERLVAIFDIGSDSVGGALTKVPVDGQAIPTIIKSVRTDVAFREEINFSMLFKDMITALGTTADSLYDGKVGVPEKIICVLASPWYLSETRVIKMARDKSFLFTDRIADELLQKEITGLNDLYLNKYGGIKSAPEMIEHHISGVSLNGYIVDDPIGKRSKSIEMNMIISLSPKTCLDKIREVLMKTFPHLKVEFSSFMVDSYLAVRDRYAASDSYLLLDVGGEVTDVAIISKGGLKASLSFPFGKKEFFKYICTKMEIELRDAKELFKLFSNDTLAVKRRKKAVPLFESIAQSWSEAFRRCISTLPHTLTLPGNIFLTADNDIQKWFQTVLETDEFIQSISTGRKATVTTLEGPEFLSMCAVKDGLCDPFLMIEAIAITKKMKK
jgi:hypothetical protein